MVIDEFMTALRMNNDAMDEETELTKSEKRNVMQEQCKKQYEILKEKIIDYQDALIDIFGNCELGILENEVIFIKSKSGRRMIYIFNSLDNNCLCFSTKDEFSYDGFYFSLIENGIFVSEVKVNLHKSGANVEVIERVYGKSRYDKNKNALLDLQSTNYVVGIKDYSSYDMLMDIDFLQKNSLLTTVFSAHMRHFYQIPSEPRNFVSTIYPSHVYFNGEDISYIYEFVDGIDKISRIYNLYMGNVKKESEDIKTIISGLADENSFNYKHKNIGNEIQVLIGEQRDIDFLEQKIEEYIEEYSGEPRPVVIGLRDATRVEVGITPMQSRKRLDDKIEDIIDDKVVSKVGRFIRKLVPSRNTAHK